MYCLLVSDPGRNKARAGWSPQSLSQAGLTHYLNIRP